MHQFYAVPGTESRPQACCTSPVYTPRALRSELISIPLSRSDLGQEWLKHRSEFLQSDEYFSINSSLSRYRIDPQSFYLETKSVLFSSNMYFLASSSLTEFSLPLPKCLQGKRHIRLHLLPWRSRILSYSPLGKIHI